MTYRESPPPPPLRGAVECVWRFAAAPDGPATTVDVLPDGCMDLVWTGMEILVAGPDTAPHPARRDPGATATGLRFGPGMLPSLLEVPAAELRDRRIPFAHFHPRLGRGAHARLELGHEPVTVLTDLARALPGEGPEPGLLHLVECLDRGASVADVAAWLGCTSRTLHRRSQAAFGYGPAVLRRVLRFRRALALLYAGVPVAEVAARAGYADQPHLSREVRALAGMAPGQVASGANRSTALPSGSCTTA